MSKLMRQPRLRRVFVVFLLASSVWTAYPQSTTSLRGTLTDSSGGLISGVMMTLSNADNGASRQVLTDGTGAYAFLQVPPGTYNVKAEKPGFTVAAREGVKLLINTPTTLFVTHNTREAISLSTRIIALAKSDVEGQGSTIALDLPVPDPLPESKVTDLIRYIEERTQPMPALKKGTTEQDYVVLQAPRA
jgi:hypothetical protein